MIRRISQGSWSGPGPVSPIPYIEMNPHIGIRARSWSGARQRGNGSADILEVDIYGRR